MNLGRCYWAFRTRLLWRKTRLIWRGGGFSVVGPDRPTLWAKPRGLVLYVAPSDPLTYRPTMFKKLPKMMKNRYSNNHVKVDRLPISEHNHRCWDNEVPLVDCICIKSFERYRGRNRCMYRNNEVQSGWIKSVVLTHLEGILLQWLELTRWYTPHLLIFCAS